jgi:dachs protein
MQHFFNTHIFKSSIESCREEGIQCELEPDYVDNVPCIDLISSLVLDILPFNAGGGDERIGFLSSHSI